MKIFVFSCLLTWQALAVWGFGRCSTVGDGLDTEQQADGRRAWAKKCLATEIGSIELFSLIEHEGKQRAGYPSFAIISNDGKVSNPLNYIAPTDPNAPCNIPEGYKIVHACMAGCYTPDQTILFSTGYTPIGIAHEKSLSTVMTLSEQSILGNPILVSSPVAYYITDVLPGTHRILEFTTQSGGSLSVTPNHPLIDGNGYIRVAKTLSTEDCLVTELGTLDPIVSIKSKVHYGKVHNLEVNNSNPTEKIIIAQGFLNGTSYYQNEGMKNLNRKILRTNLIHDDVIQ